MDRFFLLLNYKNQIVVFIHIPKTNSTHPHIILGNKNHKISILHTKNQIMRIPTQTIV